MKLYLVRHPLSERNTGEDSNQDCPLAKAGLAQANAVIRWFNDKRLNAVYSSPMIRTRYLAETISTTKGMRPSINDELREYDMGVYGTVKDDWSRYWADAGASQTPFGFFQPLGGESFNELHHRAHLFFEELTSVHERDDSILLVGHGYHLKHMLLGALGLDVSYGQFFGLANASVTEIDVDDQGLVTLRRLNDISHLLQSNGSDTSVVNDQTFAATPWQDRGSLQYCSNSTNTFRPEPHTTAEVRGNR